MILSLWNVTGIAAAMMPRCLSNLGAIDSRGFESTRSCGKTCARLMNTSHGWRHMCSKAYQLIEANNKETIRALCITAYMCWRSTSSGMTSPHKGMAQQKVCAYHDVSMLYTDASLLVKRHATEITILQTIYSNAFSWMKIPSVWLESH